MGELIRNAREARGWSQTYLAVRVRTSQQYISKLEKDAAANPGSIILGAIARELGIPITELLAALEAATIAA